MEFVVAEIGHCPKIYGRGGVQAHEQRGEGQAEGGAEERRLQRQLEQAARAGEAVQGHVEGDAFPRAAQAVEQADGGAGRGQGAQALGVEQVRLGQQVAGVLFFADLGQHGAALVVDEDRDQAVALDRLQPVDGPRRQGLALERRAGRAVQDDGRRAVAAGQRRAGRPDRLEGLVQLRLFEGTDLAHPFGVEGMRRGPPLGQDRQASRLHDALEGVRLDGRRRRQDQQAGGRPVGAADHHRLALGAQQLDHAGVAHRRARQRMRAGVAVAAEVGGVGRQAEEGAEGEHPRQHHPQHRAGGEQRPRGGLAGAHAQVSAKAKAS